MNARDITITTLIENSTERSGIQAEWGLSVFIEAGGAVFLLDTGSSGMVVRNADRLGIDLRRIESIILSHGHYDHTGGLLAVLERMGRADVPVIAHPSITEKKYSYRKNTGSYHYAGITQNMELLANAGARFEFSSQPVWLGEDIAVSGEEPMTTAFESVAENLLVKNGGGFSQDTMKDDQSLFIRTGLGLIVILGCAHRGMINIIRYGRELMKTERVYMVLGGTHLGPASEGQLNETIKALKEIAPVWIGVSHCTGLPAAAKLASEFSGRFFFNSAGRVLRLPLER